LLLAAHCWVWVVPVVHLLLGRGHHLSLHPQRVHVRWVVQVLLQHVRVERVHALVLDVVLSREEVNALVLQLLQEFLFLPLEELVLGHVVRVRVVVPHAVGLRQLLLKDLALGLCRWVWLDVLRPEETQKLVRNFGQGLLGQQHRVVHEFSEGYELHNVGSHVLVVLSAEQGHLVGIQLVHGREVSIPNTHNDDAEW